MTRSNVAMAALVAVLTMIVPLTAQQGEGNGLATLTTGIDLGLKDSADKPINNSSLVEITLTSNTGGGGFLILIAGRILYNQPQPSFNFGSETGLIGLNLLTEANVIINGAVSFPPFVLGPTQTFTVYVIVPPSALNFPLSDLMVQGLCSDVSGVQGWAVSNSIRHKGQTPVFMDTCEEAVWTSGLSDADLGVPFSVDTATFNNNVSTSGLAGLGTETNFQVQLAANGTGASHGAAPDVFVRFTATSGGSYTFDFCDSNYDTRVWLMPETCALPVSGIVHNDDAAADLDGDCFMPGDLSASRLRSICLAPGQTVLLVIDGFGSAAGTASFVITKDSVEVFAISPSFVDSACPGDVLTVHGAGFEDGAVVEIDGMPVAVTFIDCTTLEVERPLLAPGSYDVTVINPDASLFTLVAGVSYGVAVYPSITNGPVATDDGHVIVSLLCPLTFYGVQHTQVWLDANGRILFGATGTGDWTESPAELRTHAPSINLFWDDCNPSAIAGASIVATETASGLNVVYSGIPRYTVIQGLSSGMIDIDRATGEIVLSYGAMNLRGCIAGISPGDLLYSLTPAEIDFSAAGTFTAADALDPIFEQLLGPEFSDPCDLGNQTFRFIPMGGPGVGPYMFSNP